MLIYLTWFTILAIPGRSIRSNMHVKKVILSAMMGFHLYSYIERRRTLVVCTMSLVCADIAKSLIFFVTIALYCIVSVR